MKGGVEGSDGGLEGLRRGIDTGCCSMRIEMEKRDHWLDNLIGSTQLDDLLAVKEISWRKNARKAVGREILWKYLKRED